MQVYIVTYFYPDGTYAGIVGAYNDEVTAQTTIGIMKIMDYPDCTFVITQTEVE